MCLKHLRVAVRMLVASSTSCCLLRGAWAFLVSAASFSSLTLSNCFLASLNLRMSLEGEGSGYIWSTCCTDNVWQGSPRDSVARRCRGTANCITWCFYLSVWLLIDWLLEISADGSANLQGGTVGRRLLGFRQNPLKSKKTSPLFILNNHVSWKVACKGKQGDLRCEIKNEIRSGDNMETMMMWPKQKTIKENGCNVMALASYSVTRGKSP